MTMMARAMAVTGLDENDAAEVENTLALDFYMTRAEAAVIVRRLLQQSDLIYNGVFEGSEKVD
jgi:hypothetical protein